MTTTTTAKRTRKTSAAKKTIRDYPEVVAGRERREALRAEKQKQLRRLDDNPTVDDQADVNTRVRAIEREEQKNEHALRAADVLAQIELRSNRWSQYADCIRRIDAALTNVGDAWDKLEAFRQAAKLDGVTFKGKEVIGPEPIMNCPSAATFHQRLDHWRGRMRMGRLLPKK